MKITEAMRKRVRRAGYRFTADRCLICGNAFSVCPHSTTQNQQLIQAVQPLDLT